MKKNVLTSIITNLLLITFVIVWIIPTVGLFVSSFRDKDLLATSGWWTTFKTNKVNEKLAKEDLPLELRAFCKNPLSVIDRAVIVVDMQNVLVEVPKVIMKSNNFKLTLQQCESSADPK